MAKRPMGYIGFTLLCLLLTLSVACGQEQQQTSEGLVNAIEALGEASENVPESKDEVTIVEKGMDPDLQKETQAPVEVSPSQSIATEVPAFPSTPVVALSPTPVPSAIPTVTPTPTQTTYSPTSTPRPGTKIVRPLGGIHKEAGNAQTCWKRAADLNERLLCNLIDTSVAESLADLNQSAITPEPPDLVPFLLDKDDLGQMIVGTTRDVPNTHLRSDYVVHDLRQYNSFIPVQDDTLFVPVPAVLESDSWDKFLAMLDANELMQPDDVILEEWINALAFNYGSRKGVLDHNYPLYQRDDLDYEVFNSYRLRNTHIDLHADTAASPFSSDLNRFILRVTAVHAAPHFGRESDLVIVMDRSASMGSDDRLLVAKEVASLLAYHHHYDVFPKRDVGVITYSDTVEELLNIHGYEFYTDVSQMLERIYPTGHGIPVDAVKAAYASAAPDRNVNVVLFTDGLDGLSSAGYEELITLVESQVGNGHTLSVVDVNPDATTPNYALLNLANRGEGAYQNIRNFDDVLVFMDFKFRMIQSNSLRDAGMLVQFNEELVEKVRLIGYEDYEPSVGLSFPRGNHGFEGKRVALFDVYLKDTADFNPRAYDTRFRSGFLRGSNMSRSTKSVFRGYIVAHKPFTNEDRAYSQHFKEKDVLNYNANISLVPYIMIAGLGELMRKSPWACDGSDYLTVQSLIDYGVTASESDIYIHEIEDILRKVQILALTQNVDFCSR